MEKLLFVFFAFLRGKNLRALRKLLRIVVQSSMRGHGRGFVCPLPEGDSRIAHAFKRGIVAEGPPVPKGRLNHSCINGNRSRRETSEGLDRPFGTYATANRDPAVNCRAILESPSGRPESPAQNVQTPAPRGARRRRQPRASALVMAHNSTWAAA